jgi:hypothetical protein
MTGTLVSRRNWLAGAAAATAAGAAAPFLPPSNTAEAQQSPITPKLEDPVGPPTDRFIEQVQQGLEGLTDYTKAMAQLSRLRTYVAPTISTGLIHLGYRLNAMQIAERNRAFGIHLMHREAGSFIPVIILAENYQPEVDPDGRRVPTFTRHTTVEHEFGHQMLYFLGHILNSPAEFGGRRDVSHTPSIRAKFEEDMTPVLRGLLTLAQNYGSGSENYQREARALLRIGVMLPHDLVPLIQSGNITNEVIDRVRLWSQRGAAETLAQTLTNAQHDPGERRPGIISPEDRALYARLFPRMTRLGNAAHNVLSQSYSDGHMRNAVGFLIWTQTNFINEMNRQYDLNRPPVRRRPSPGPTPKKG